MGGLLSEAATSVSWFMLTVEFHESEGRENRAEATDVVLTQEVFPLLNLRLFRITLVHCKLCYLILFKCFS